jgi:hypothetical protein
MSAAVGAGFGVKAGVQDAEAVDGAAGYEVLVDDGFGILGGDAAVPYGFGVDNNGGAVLALVQTAGFVDPDPSGEAGLLDELLEAGVEGAGAVGGAGGARSAGGAGVEADEDVTFKGGQAGRTSGKRMIPE